MLSEGIYDVKSPILISLLPLILYILISLVLIIFLAFIVNKSQKFIKKKQTSITAKISLNQILNKAIKDIKHIRNSVKSENNINYELIYSQISEIIRTVMGYIHNVNALSKTKSELLYLNLKHLDETLESCYKVEFGKYISNKEITINFIDKVLNILKQCV